MPDEAFEETRAFVTQWQRAWEPGTRRPSLAFRYSPGYLRLEDARTATRTPEITEYDDLAARLYAACSDQPVSLGGLTRVFQLDEASTEQASTLLASFCERSFMLEEDGKYLALALPASEQR